MSTLNGVFWLSHCADVNECDTSANQCAFRCFNMPGTFRCICPMGYKVAADQIHCEGKTFAILSR